MTKIFLVAIFSILIGNTLSGEIVRADQTIEKSFTVSKGGTLFLRTDLGAISVITAPGNSVNVKVIHKFSGWDEEDEKEFMKNFDIEFSQTPDDVNVTARLKEDWSRKRENLQIEFEIAVPSRYNVDLKTAGGSISVDDLEGSVDAETSGGSLKFGDISGPVTGVTSGGSIVLKGSKGDADLKTSGGSITLGMVNGNVDARTSGGSITIDEAQGNVYAKTSGGSINVDEVLGTIEATTSGGSVNVNLSRQPAENCRLETSGGSISVYMAENIAVDIDAKTTSGRVESDFEIKGERGDDNGWVKGSVNGGGQKLYLRTSGGNIYIYKK